MKITDLSSSTASKVKYAIEKEFQSKYPNKFIPSYCVPNKDIIKYFYIDVELLKELATIILEDLNAFLNSHILLRRYRDVTIIDDKPTNKIIKGKHYQIVETISTYNHDYCPCCGCVNEFSKDIIKWGYRKNCIIKIPKVSNCKTRLILHKQRFYCKNCNNTFIVETNLVVKNKNTSNNTELQIRKEIFKSFSKVYFTKRNCYIFN